MNGDRLLQLNGLAMLVPVGFIAGSLIVEGALLSLVLHMLATLLILLGTLVYIIGAVLHLSQADWTTTDGLETTAH
jgi:hypothetical protein